MSDREPTAAERRFFEDLLVRLPELHDWYHEDPDGRPWMIVSHDFVVDRSIRATLRVDYDGRDLRGGWSPACLNWDDGVRAADASIDTNPPDGLSRDGVAPDVAAAIAGQWFAEHIARRARG